MSDFAGGRADLHGSPADLPAYGNGDHRAPRSSTNDQPAVPFPDPAIDPRSGRRRRAAIGMTGIAIVAVVAAAATLLMSRTSPSESTSGGGAASAPTPVLQTATDCTRSASSGEVPTSGMVSAGGLSFPQSVAPQWRAKAEHRVPNSVDAVSLDEKVSDMGESTWIGQLTVGGTNFDQSMTLANQARLMLKCVVRSALYEGTSPSVAEATPVPGRLDGTPISTIEVPISVSVADPAITGDDVVLVIVGTSPSTYFLATSPFGDTGRRAVVDAAWRGLHVSSV